MKWIEPGPISSAVEITEAFGSSILLAQQLAKRSIETVSDAQAYLDPSAYPQTSPFDFPDMHKAVLRIQKAIHNQGRIGIWGDFDVDGQTSTAVLLDGLRNLGADVCYHIPNRALESHGIQLSFLQEFMRSDLDLLITCDTGISELPALQYAAEQGLDVILSDHHTPAGQLPPALAIINPRLLPAGHPLENLAGVGTAYQIIRALVERLGLVTEAQQYLDLVALGTIADLAALEQENRYYTQLGLMQMKVNLRPSLAAILDMADYRGSDINESLIGYTIAPRLNAVGRLEDANSNVEFLLSCDPAFLAQTAGRLEELNNQRKLAVEGVYQSAREMLDREPALSRNAALVLAKSGWEKGVVGIAASRLVEEFNKPVILLNIEDDIAAGSVRSVEGINIIQAIQENAAHLNSFGGHPMAAGLSLQLKNLPAFRAALSQTVQTAAKTLPAEKQLQIDSYLPISNLNRELLEEINSLAPFGSGNPPPVLVCRNLEIKNSVNLGKNDTHRKLTVQNETGEEREVIWWNARKELQPQGKFDLAYYLRENHYNGQSAIVLEWIDCRESAAAPPEISLPLFTNDIQDFRMRSNQLLQISDWLPQHDICIWGEGFDRKPEIRMVDRLQVSKTNTLAILTPPPSFTILRQVLKKVSPKQVFLLRVNQPDDRLDGFLEKVSGLIKYTINHYQGKTNISKLAAALAQTETLLKLGLQWWQAHGEIRLEFLNADEVIFEKNQLARQEDAPSLTRLTSEIYKGLSETAAFRSFYLRADPAFLLRKI
jgi:single-stranded-DNA-specific exonuclease